MEELAKYVNRAERLEWSEYYASIALLASARSPCKRLRVGCVLVKDKRVVSVGYNGFLQNAPHESIVVDNHEQATAHAESNCVANAARAGVITLQADAYITHFPCINCYKLLVAAGIQRIFYINDYNNDENVLRLSNLCGVPVINQKNERQQV